jgi:hypothetical protein
MNQLYGRGLHRLEHGKFPGHFSMMKIRKPHLLRQVMPQPWGTNDGLAQLRVSGLQKGELLELCLALPLGLFPGPTLCCKLILKEGDLLDKALGILMSRGQRHGVLHLCS